MKKLHLGFLTLIICGYMSLFAGIIDERKTDIYFGNGVWNDEYSRDCLQKSAANCSQYKLNELIAREIIKNRSFPLSRWECI